MKKIFLLLSFLCCSAYIFAGDDPCSATPIGNDLNDFVQFSNVGTTDSNYEYTACGEYSGNDFWLSFTPPASGVVTIETLAGSLDDLSLIVYWGACNGLASINYGCYQDFNCGENTMPQLTLDGLFPGETYHIRLWQEGGGTGTFSVRVSDPFSQPFELNGSAFPVDLGEGLNCVQLTTEQTGQSGCAWYPVDIDFSQPFDQNFIFNFGDIDANGADGLTLVYQPNGFISCGGTGQGIGAQGIPQSLIIEFDTWDNGGGYDIPQDHISINRNGNVEAPLFGPTSIGYNIEDGEYHTINISWNPDTRNFTVAFNEVVYLDVTYDIVDDIFNGDTEVTWGVTGATGGSFNNQTLCFERITVTNNSSVTFETSEYLCQGNQLFVGGAFQSEAGVYEDIYEAQNGCDSVVLTQIFIENVEAISQTEINLPCDVTSTQVTLDASESITGETANISWTTNDGTIVSGGNTLTPTVDGSGTYNLFLLDSASGCNDNVSVNVIVSEPPVAIAEDAVFACEDVQINSLGTSTGDNYAYEWTTSDGNILMGQNEISPLVNSAGTYQLLVTDTLSGCTAETSLNITGVSINAGQGSALCSSDIPFTTTLQGTVTGDILSFEWQPATGLSDPTSLTPTATITTPVDYQLVATVTNSNNAAETCEITSMISFSLDDLQTNASDGTIDCINETANLVPITTSSFGSDFTYQWTSSEGSFISTTDIESPQVNAAGIYNYTVTNIATGCTATTALMVQNNSAIPDVEIGSNQNLDCENETAILSVNSSSGWTYAWSTTNGNITGNTNETSITVDQAGDYSIEVMNTQNGCSNTESFTVNQDNTLPVFSIENPDSITCINTEINLSATANNENYTYVWTSSTGTILSGENSSNPTVNQTGQYDLLVTNSENACTETQSVVVDENIITPIVDAGLTEELNCTTTSIFLAGTSSDDDFNLEWTSTGGNILMGENTLNPEINASGTYTLTATNSENGCSASDEVIISQDNNIPVALIEIPAVLDCTISTIQLNAEQSSTGSNYSYEWTTEDGNLSLGSNPLQPTVNAPGAYSLIITDEINDCSTTSTIQVEQNITQPIVELTEPDILNCILLETNISTVFDVENDYSLLWSSPNASITSDPTQNQISVDAAGDYNLMVTNNENGCTEEFSQAVLQNADVPTVNAGLDTMLTCTTNEILLEGTYTSNSTNISLEWTTENGNIETGTNEINTLINQSGTYELVVTDLDNNCTASDELIVGQDVDVPTAIIAEPDQLNCGTSALVLDANQSSSGDTFLYEWTTENGVVTSGENSLSPEINTAGLYELLITNTANNCTTTASVEVEADESIPSANILDAIVLDCETTSTQLEAMMGLEEGNFEYNWTTENGNIDAFGNTLTPTISGAGVYELTILNTENDCSSTVNIEVLEDVDIPSLELSEPDLLTCTTLETTLFAISETENLNYIWTSNNTEISSIDSVLVSNPNTYYVEITNPENGCSDMDSVVVTQNIEMPIADAGQNTELTCTETTLILDGSNSSLGADFSYEWASEGGQILENGNTLTPLIESDGTYQLLVTNTENGCAMSSEMEVSLNQNAPVILVSTPNSITCAQSTAALDVFHTETANLTFDWSTNDGSFISETNTSSSFVNSAGTYQIVVTNLENGCLSTETLVVEQNTDLPNVDAGDGLELTCSETTFNLNGSVEDSENISTNWFTETGNIETDNNTLNPLINAAGMYYLTATNSINSCTNIDSVLITQNENIPINIITDIQEPLCFGDLGGFNVELIEGGLSPYIYSVDNGDNFFTQSEFPELESGVYEIQIMDANGCELATDVVIPFVDSVYTNLIPSVELNIGEQYNIEPITNINPAEIQTIEWSPAIGLSCDDCLEPTFLGAQNQSYTLTITNENGCIASDQIIFQVDQSIDVYIPNAFTPNDDAVNDGFMIFARENTVANIHNFQVFDRWGNQVFELNNFLPNDPDFAWDGRFKDKEMDAAVFVYFVDIEYINGNREILKGDVTLVR